MMRIPPVSLTWRFQRLRTVAAAWEIRYQQLPEQAVAAFAESDLEAIRRLVLEKRRLERLIPEIHEFIRKWEENAEGEPIIENERSSIF